MWKAYGTGFLTTIGPREEKKTYYVSNVESGAFVTFRIRSRRYAGGKNIWENLDCKKYVKGNPENFCKLLVEQTFISVTGTLEIYYNTEKKTTKYTLNCENIDFCGKVEPREKKEEEQPVAATAPATESEPF